MSVRRFTLQKRNPRRFINSGGRWFNREFPVDPHDSERDETLSKKYVSGINAERRPSNLSCLETVKTV
jgi:hypothetical protein